MTGSCNDAAQSFAKTICSICYEDLKPIVEDLQAISICGHVFHELCIQQWFEYCAKGKKKCPICKQTCTPSNVSRLYFQSVGDSNEPKLSQKPQTQKEDPEELKLDVMRLEGKVKGLNLALESQENELKNVSNELCVCKEQLEKETSLKNKVLEQTRTVNRLLDTKTQNWTLKVGSATKSNVEEGAAERNDKGLPNTLLVVALEKDLYSRYTEPTVFLLELNKSDLDRIKLQERNMALAKELASLKLMSDLNLNEEEIVKLSSLGTQAHSKDSIDVLKKSLVVRNKMYKDLIAKCNILGRDEARSRKKLEKAKEKLHKLKTRVQELETANEMKDNELLRSLKASKNTKTSPYVQNVQNAPDLNPTPTPTHIDPCTPQTTINEPYASAIDDDDLLYRKTKRFRGSESIDEKVNKDGVSGPTPVINSYILIDDDAPEVSKSKDKNDDDDVVVVDEIHEQVYKSMPNITKEASFPGLDSQKAGDFCFSGGLLGPDGSKRHLGKWCKKGISIPTTTTQSSSGDLIAVGSDGRGGTIKVLKSQSLSSMDYKKPSVTAKNSKFGAKTSSLQSRGSLQIDHFFRKAGQ